MPDQPVTEKFDDDGIFPNSALPLLLYRAAMAPSDATPEAMEALFGRNGWPPQWRSGVYPFHHYHSTAHECLGVASGEAVLVLGGPKGREFHVRAGDVIVIPAGVAHKRVSASEDFLVIGAYPPGADWDLRKGEPGDRPRADENIARVTVPTSDPVTGGDDGLTALW